MQVGVQWQGTEKEKEKVIWRRRKLPSFPALEHLLAYEYNTRFNGIGLPSVELVDLTLGAVTELVE